MTLCAPVAAEIKGRLHTMAPAPTSVSEGFAEVEIRRHAR
jgi:hypothetical protein